MNRRIRNHAGGWLLIEILVLLVLLGVFLLLASRLFISIARIERDTRHAEMLATRFDVMLWRLRRDVWRCTAMETGGDALILTLPESERITWRFGDTVTREAAEATVDWPSLPSRWTLTTAPGRVTLQVGADGAGPGGTRFTLVSQLAQRRETP